MAVGAYPVRVDADLDPNVSRWLWVVKWVLAFPHYVVLALLWVAFVLVSIAAFFAIAFTGRYPRSMFEFNVGVLRWSWRVHYYSFGALATDKYPPFSLAEIPDYPAHLEVAYPQHLSRGLVWVKWWLLALPHYLVVGIFVGGSWAAWQSDSRQVVWSGGGLLGLFVFIAAIALLVTGRYPKPIFDLVLGLNRWVLRVAAYAALLTDQYPPFRLDMGGHEPPSTMVFSPAGPEGSPGWAGGPGQPETWPPPPPPPGLRRGWTAGRVTSLVIGAVLALVSFGLLAGGGLATWADRAQRDAAGYVTTGPHSFSTNAYALTSGRIDLGSSADAVTPSDFLGTVRLQVTPADQRAGIFVGLARQASLDRYLAGTGYDELTDWTRARAAYTSHLGAAPALQPATAGIWASQSSGSGTQTITWKPQPGHWAIVVMNSDASPGLAVSANMGATLPDLGWLGAGLLAGGFVLLLIAGTLVITPIARASR